MKKISILIISILLSGCGSTLVTYIPTDNLDINDALDLADEIIMSQHIKWKPDYVKFEDKYILLNYGAKATGRSSSFYTDYGFAVGNSSTEYHNIGQKIYYKSIGKITLIKWHRKLKEWWVVQVRGIDNKIKKNIFYTRNAQDAKKLIDALDVIVKHGKEKILKNKTYEENHKNGSSSPQERLRVIDELKKNNSITEEEYIKKRKEIIEDI